MMGLVQVDPWTAFIAIADACLALSRWSSLRRVREGEGKVIKVTRGIDGEYTHAVVQDPVGAYLALVPG